MPVTVLVVSSSQMVSRVASRYSHIFLFANKWRQNAVPAILPRAMDESSKPQKSLSGKSFKRAINKLPWNQTHSCSSSTAAAISAQVMSGTVTRMVLRAVRAFRGRPCWTRPLKTRHARILPQPTRSARIVIPMPAPTHVWSSTQLRLRRQRRQPP